MNLLLFMLIDNSDRILEILSDLDFFGLIQASMPPRDTQHRQRGLPHGKNDFVARLFFVFCWVCVIPSPSRSGGRGRSWRE